MDITIPINDPSLRIALYGTADRNLRLIRATFNVRLSARDGSVRISGPPEEVRQAAHAVNRFQELLGESEHLTEEVVQDVLREAARLNKAGDGPTIDVYTSTTKIAPRGVGQTAYVEAIFGNDLTFCLGPAGTGKTYLAVAVAVSLLRRQRIKRIVLVRPAVEAGERLGYLPGDLQAKVNPYLRPLFDAMNDMMPFDQIKRFMANDVIEIMPLAFMRGRTLNESVIILDEAQNATPSQMLMFLTRLGFNSKMIVTGDDSQSDLAGGEASGLVDAIDRLEGEERIGLVRLHEVDIVRHPLVQRIVGAYARREASDHVADSYA